MQTSDFIATKLGIKNAQVRSTIQLLKEGGTIPFIARYRKEQTGSLDEVAIAQIQKSFNNFNTLLDRKSYILDRIDEMDQLTPELRKKIENTFDSNILEDLYLPFKKKRKTRAQKAKDAGLEPLALTIFSQRSDAFRQKLHSHRSNVFPTDDDVLSGCRDIIAEKINEDQQIRNLLRSLFDRYAIIKSKVVKSKKEEGIKYKDYFEFEQHFSKCKGHRILALFRGEKEGILKLTTSPDNDRTIEQLSRKLVKNNSFAGRQVQEALEDGYKRLLKPAIENEFRNKLKEKADSDAIMVFADNLKQLLLAPPLGNKSIIAIDPGFRTGCKLVCLDDAGGLLHNTTIFPHPPQNQFEKAKQVINRLIKQYNIDAIAIGNGTAGRETMALCSSLSLPDNIDVFFVNENGASIYSASSIAREEFPSQDITVRGAVSIGRRLMDPLAELIKIDAKSIGVGQYQHDVNQNLLKEELDKTVESCVNSVGININTASKHLLTYVSGLGPTLAQNIVQYRKEIGYFESRQALKKVPRMGNKAFELAAGFLRIREGKNPLDNTGVHPERYNLVQKIAKDQKTTIPELLKNPSLLKEINLSDYLSQEVGIPTLKDIFSELEKPGLDPRGEANTVQFDQQIKTIDDLQDGQRLPGVVTNITDFGAFVDIGIKQDGLIHISQMSQTFVEHPSKILKLGQQLIVRVTSIDIERNRIQLSLKD